MKKYQKTGKMPLSCQSSRMEGDCWKDCGNYRRVSLLSIAEKIFACILLNRLKEHIVPHIVPETRCGIRSGRGTVDMIDPLFATVIREV